MMSLSGDAQAMLLKLLSQRLNIWTTLHILTILILKGWLVKFILPNCS